MIYDLKKEKEFDNTLRFLINFESISDMLAHLTSFTSATSPSSPLSRFERCAQRFPIRPCRLVTAPVLCCHPPLATPGLCRFEDVDVLLMLGITSNISLDYSHYIYHFLFTWVDLWHFFLKHTNQSTTCRKLLT